jgi:lysophospholipase L1-like esterase
MLSYYKKQFSKIGVRVVNDAASGLDAKDWNANKRHAACLKHAISSTPGKGENTILEYSFGINDQGRKTPRSEQKKRYKDGIIAYLKAKPKATVILAIPVAHGSASKNQELKDIYTEISKELNLMLIDTLAITEPIYGDKRYYNDGTHPNSWGSRRIVNYIMNQIVPSKISSKITLPKIEKKIARNNNELFKGVENGYYSDITNKWGAKANAANSWRVKEIKVEPNFILKIKTGGNRNEIFFMNEAGKCIHKRYLGALGRRKYITCVIPPDGVAIRLTLSISDKKYNPKNDKMSIKYDVGKAHYMSNSDINKGLNIIFKEER